MKKKSDPLQIELDVVTTKSHKLKTVATADLRDTALLILKPSTPIACLGIDPGMSQLTLTVLPVSRTGQNDKAFVYTFKTKGEPGDGWKERFFRIEYLTWGVQQVLEGLNRSSVDKTLYIGIEGYAFGLRGSAVQTMAEIRQNLLHVILSYYDAKVYILPIPSWKACLCPGLKKAGISSKEAVQVCLQKYWPSLKAFGKDHNRYDSFGIATVLYRMLFKPRLHNPSLDRLREREGINGSKEKEG